MTDARLNRLQSIETNAWRNYQQARYKAQAKRTPKNLDAVIEAGEKWQRNNENLHYYLSALKYDQRSALYPIYA